MKKSVLFLVLLVMAIFAVMADAARPAAIRQGGRQKAREVRRGGAPRAVRIQTRGVRVDVAPGSRTVAPIVVATHHVQAFQLRQGYSHTANFTAGNYSQRLVAPLTSADCYPSATSQAPQAPPEDRTVQPEVFTPPPMQKITYRQTQTLREVAPAPTYRQTTVLREVATDDCPVTVAPALNLQVRSYRQNIQADSVGYNHRSAIVLREVAPVNTGHALNVTIHNHRGFFRR